MLAFAFTANATPPPTCVKLSVSWTVEVEEAELTSIEPLDLGVVVEVAAEVAVVDPVTLWM
jgi:hypothetical protein